MGIMAGYTGADGGTRTFDLEGVPTPGTVAAGLLGAQPLHAPQLTLGGAPLAMPMPQMPEMPPLPSMADDADRGKVKLTEGDMPDVLSRKLMPSGSIVSGAGGLCLKGEEGGTPGGRRMYGTRDGVNGFFSLSEMDTGAGGVELNGTGETPDGGMATLDGYTGVTLRVGGRIDIQMEVSDAGERFMVVRDFYRLADISPYGRIVRISKEIDRLVMKQPLGGGGGNGKYGVKPVFEGGSLSALMFGTEQELDSGRPSSTVETATCPNAAQEDD